MITEELLRLVTQACGEPLCDACLGLALKAPLATIQPITAALAAQVRDYQRGVRRCASCHRVTMTVAFASPVGRANTKEKKKRGGG